MANDDNGNDFRPIPSTYHNQFNTSWHLLRWRGYVTCCGGVDTATCCGGVDMSLAAVAWIWRGEHLLRWREQHENTDDENRGPNFC